MQFWRKYAHILIILLVGLSLSYVAFMVAVDWGRRNVQTRFNRLSQLQVLQIEDSIVDNLDFVRMVATLHHVTEDIKFHAFSTFVRHANHPGLDAVLWLPRVKYSDRLIHEKRATHNQGYQILEPDSDGGLQPATKRAEYFPVYYAEYAEAYVAKAYPPGLDFNFLDSIQQRMNRARDQAKLVMKKAGPELTAEGGKPKYLVIYPVDAGDAATLGSTTKRRASLSGFVIGIEDMGDAVENSIDPTAIKGIDIRLYDLSDEIIPELVYVHKSKKQIDYNSADMVDVDTELKYEKRFSAAERNWLIVATPAPGYFSSQDSWLAWAVLGFGFFGTVVFSAYLFGLARQADHTEQLVLQRTAELSAKKKELEIYSQALSRSNDELQQFAYVASHDLQEPLRMVASFTRLLKQRYGQQLDENANEYINFATDGVERMRVLINDLLAYSRVDTTSNKLESVDMLEIIGWALSNLRASIDEAKAEIVYEDLPRIIGDKSQLQRLMQNLVSNAIKYYDPQRRPKVIIHAERDGRDWRFSVTDNGVGIDSKHYERIFEVFQRIHSGDIYTGGGMGLAICKKIVKRHGGRIWLESAPTGIGTKVNFTLPAMLNELTPSDEVGLVESAEATVV